MNLYLSFIDYSKALQRQFPENMGNNGKLGCPLIHVYINILNTLRPSRHTRRLNIAAIFAVTVTDCPNLAFLA